MRFDFRAYFLLIFLEYKILVETKVQCSVFPLCLLWIGVDGGRWPQPAIPCMSPYCQEIEKFRFYMLNDFSNILRPKINLSSLPNN